MNHRLSVLLSADFTLLMSQSDAVGDSIILSYRRMINGNISDTSLKIAHWIATNFHHLFNQPIAVFDRDPGFVNEACLLSAPGLSKIVSLFLGQRFDI